MKKTNSKYDGMTEVLTNTWIHEDKDCFLKRVTQNVSKT